MKAIFALLLIVAGMAFAEEQPNLQCESKKSIVPTEWRDMKTSCVKSVRDQIQNELRASMQYLAMGAHFSRDIVNRPGFAKIFFEAASEEREHALKLIELLLRRGELTESVSNLFQTYVDVGSITWKDGIDALRGALELETLVTKDIKEVIKTCEQEVDGNDYYIVDYLSGEFLEEQYKGQRELAGKISVLDKFMGSHGPLGEFLYDKKLLA